MMEETRRLKEEISAVTWVFRYRYSQILRLRIFPDMEEVLEKVFRELHGWEEMTK